MDTRQAMARAICITATPVLLIACSGDKNSQTHQVGDYFITVTTDPPKLQVGSDAEITAHIGRDDDDVAGCRVSFRQYMPAHQMTTDRTLHAMTNLGKGLYRARGTDFGMGGDWELEFQFNCGDGTKTAVFAYQLQWM